MRAALHWPVEIVHEKCQSSLESMELDLHAVTINRKGVLTFHMCCFLCDDTFIVVKNMLELTTLAALDDKEYLGDDLNVLNPVLIARPN